MVLVYLPKPPPVFGRPGVTGVGVGVGVTLGARTFTAHVAVRPALVTVKVLTPSDAKFAVKPEPAELEMERSGDDQT